MRSFYRTTPDNNPLGALSTALAVKYGRLTGAAKEAAEARFEARRVKLAERRALEEQLLDIERRLRNVSVLPAPHPARALEAGLISEAAALRIAIDAVVVPPHPDQVLIDAAIARMYGR